MANNWETWQTDIIGTEVEDIRMNGRMKDNKICMFKRNVIVRMNRKLKKTVDDCHAMRNFSRNKDIKTNQKFLLKIFQHRNQKVKEYKLWWSLHQNGLNRLSIKHNTIYNYICKDFWTTAPKTRILKPSLINIYQWGTLTYSDKWWQKEHACLKNKRLKKTTFFRTKSNPEPHEKAKRSLGAWFIEEKSTLPLKRAILLSLINFW